MSYPSVSATDEPITPDNLPDVNVPPADGPSEKDPRKIPGDNPDVNIELPSKDQRDLTKDHPDAEDDIPGRSDPNILEDEEMN